MRNPGADAAAQTPSMIVPGARLSRLLRIYAALSIVTLFMLALIFTACMRHVAMNKSFEVAQLGNLQLAQSALQSIHGDLLHYLEAKPPADELHGGATYQLSPALAKAITDIMRSRPVARIKIFDRHGMVAYSTHREQIGDRQHATDGFANAIKGTAHTVLVYRDAFNRFGQSGKDENLIQTYMPVRAHEQAPVVGVFEIYTDANALAAEIERQVLFMVVAVALIIALFYGIQSMLMHKAARLIELQRRAIQERSDSLEMLSAELLREEEVKKRRIAHVLHAGLAQTLSAIKLSLQDAHVRFAVLKDHGKSLEPILPLLQNAIQEVQSTAMQLRPPSLDELGLLPTIDWFCREFQQMHKEIAVDCSIQVEESSIPRALRVVIYRIIESAFVSIARHAEPERLALTLKLDAGTIALSIEEVPGDIGYFAGPRQTRVNELQVHVVEARERTTLSGGTFSCTENSGGGMIMHSNWTTTKAGSDMSSTEIAS